VSDDTVDRAPVIFIHFLAIIKPGSILKIIFYAIDLVTKPGGLIHNAGFRVHDDIEVIKKQIT